MMNDDHEDKLRTAAYRAAETYLRGMYTTPRFEKLFEHSLREGERAYEQALTEGESADCALGIAREHARKTCEASARKLDRELREFDMMDFATTGGMDMDGFAAGSSITG